MAAVALNLTALMDILSNILFFLLASYTAQSVEMEGQSGLRLPSSTSQLTLNPQLTVIVTATHIEVNNVAVSNIREGAIVDPLDKDGKLGPLYERLRNLKTSRAAAMHVDPGEAALVLVLADKGTDSQTITRVLKTAGFAGFINVRFGVISK